MGGNMEMTEMVLSFDIDGVNKDHVDDATNQIGKLGEITRIVRNNTGRDIKIRMIVTEK